MPQLTVTSTEVSGSGGIPTGTGTLYLAAAFDQGPPEGGPLYVKCQSLTDVANAFGPRTSTSEEGYDALDNFFNEGGPTGKVAYVTRVTDSTATTATLTLADGQAAPKPTVLVSAQSAGSEGDNVYVTVETEPGETFTATTTNASTGLTAVSSFAGIGVGTPVTGTGIPAKTYIAAVNPTAGTATLSAAATAAGTGVTLTPGTITVEVVAEDASGDVLDTEAHGPYFTSAQLIADSTSDYVAFTQSAGTGFTTNLPAALSSTALTGGADADDLTDSSHVAALANFPKMLGPGTVILPGRTTLVCWEGIRDHCNANNRWGVLDLADTSEGSEAAGQMSDVGGGDWSRCFPIEGTTIITALAGTGGPNRTAAGSSTVAALRAQVAQGANQAVVPAGMKWPLTYALGFTQYYGPIPGDGLPAGNFDDADVAEMEAAGVNCFANFYGTLCLFGFVTPETQDPIYDQANAATERMALSNDTLIAMAPYLFDDIDQDTIDAMTNDVEGVCAGHYGNDALYSPDGTAGSAYTVLSGAPINTPATAQAKQLNVQIQTHFPRYADDVTGAIAVVPVTVALPGASS